MKPMHKQLREIGELLGLDCGDNSCLCAAHRGGMRTNGGCRCDISGAVAKLREAAETLLQAWADMTDQEMYGEMLRDGMCEPRSDAGETDFDWWAEQHDNLRAALRTHSGDSANNIENAP